MTWPLDHLFALCDPVVLTFDLIFIGGRGIVIDYHWWARYRDRLSLVGEVS